MLRRAAWAMILTAGLLAGLPAGAQEPADAPDPDRRLLATGQTRGYRGIVAEPADGNGDDGDRIRGRLPDYRLPSGEPLTEGQLPARPADNLVVDHSTGLMWPRYLLLLDGDDEEGLHANYRLDRSYSWSQALALARDFRYGGYADWRLPNVHELQSLVDFGRARPALDPLTFPEELEDLPSPYFWSSTTRPDLPLEAYYTNFLDGHAWPWHKGIGFAVRPVRSVSVRDPVAIFATGQTLSYEGAGEAPRPGQGDDGDLQLGLSRSYLWQDDGRIDSPEENQLVDERTGLVWLRQPTLLDGSGGPGGNVDLSVPLNWQEAVEACQALDYGGRQDWRLPNIRELDSLARYGSEEAPLDPAAFPGSPLPPEGDHQPPWIWWSSTTNQRDRPGLRGIDEAWYLSMASPLKRHHVFDANAGTAKAEPGYARCVRDALPADPPEGWRAEIRASADWQALSIESALPNLLRQGKYLLPTEAEAPAAPFTAAFQDVRTHLLHLDFLRQVFPEHFGSLSTSDYEALVARRATRRYVAGGLREFTAEDGRRVYGFDVYTADAPASERLAREELIDLQRRLGRQFRRRPLVYSPTRAEDIAEARGWGPGGPPVAFPAPRPDPGYELYTPGVAYGRPRLVDLADLPALTAAGGLSWQDILVLDRAPVDVEAVVSAILTGEPQGELSHLSVRSARRGTPNAYLADAHAELAEHAGRLVRLTLSREDWQVEADVDPAEAEAHWAARRPEPVVVPPVDSAHRAIEDLDAIEAGDVGRDAERRVGAKAANLARLYAVLPEENRLPGLAIPFAYYQDFMQQGRIFDPEVDPPAERSLAEHLALLQSDPRFGTDPAWRAERLAVLREAIRDAPVPDAWEDEIQARIVETFGAETMVRFRSSSNAEDGLRFNGAGLYDSTSVCALDGSDGDDDGPSRCDPNQPEERTIKRGLRKVWASLWSQRAADERSWYGIDPASVAMAILVTPAFPDEEANGVAFTGNPFDPQPGQMLVSAQLGDVSVVLPEPGVLPERDLILTEAGQVTGIRRLQSSSLVPPGSPVLSDALLRGLGDLLLLTDQRFPLDRGEYSRQELMLDVEFKVDAPDSTLYLKQVRPFLLAREPGSEPPAFLRLSLDDESSLCSGWRVTEPIASEHAERLRLELPAGQLELPLAPGIHPAPLFGALELGPERMPLEAEDAGQVEIEPLAGQPDRLSARLSRRYRPAGSAAGPETEVWLQLDGLWAGEPNLRDLDAEALRLGIQVLARQGERPAQVLTPCDLEGGLDARLELDLAGGRWAGLALRYADRPGLAPVTQARLLGADLRLADGPLRIEAPEQLVYDAGRHNWNERLWLLFDPPREGRRGIEIAAEGISTDPATRWSAWWLDGDLARAEPIAVRAARYRFGALEDWLRLPHLRR